MIYRDYYDAVANRKNIWTADSRSSLYYQEHIRYDAILARLPQSDSNVLNVLDLGCGDGYLSYLIAQKGFRVIGLDLSIKRLNKLEDAAGLLQNKQIVGDVLAPAFQKNSFDAIVCSEVIEHIEDFQTLLGEAFRMLKPTGTLIITVPHKEKLKTIHCPHCQQTFHEHGHIHSFEIPKLSGALKSAGFTISATQVLRHKLLVQLQYHFKLKYGYWLRIFDRLLSRVIPGFTVYLLIQAHK